MKKYYIEIKFGKGFSNDEIIWNEIGYEEMRFEISRKTKITYYLI